MTSFQDFATKNTLTQKQAQGAIDYFSELSSADAIAMQDRLADQAKENVDRVKAMKTMTSGAGFDANIGLANSGISKAQIQIDKEFGAQSINLGKHLEDTGIGNDPGLVQMFFVWDKTTSDDGFVTGQSNGSGPAKLRQDILYK